MTSFGARLRDGDGDVVAGIDVAFDSAHLLLGKSWGPMRLEAELVVGNLLARVWLNRKGVA